MDSYSTRSPGSPSAHLFSMNQRYAEMNYRYTKKHIERSFETTMTQLEDTQTRLAQLARPDHSSELDVFSLRAFDKTVYRK